MYKSRLARPMLVFAVTLAIALSWWFGVRAAGGGSYLSITSSSSSATADGSSKITLTAYSYKYLCPGSVLGDPGVPCSDGSMPVETPSGSKEVVLTPSGDLIFGGTQTGGDGKPYVIIGSDGKAQFTLASSTAGTKQLSATFEIGWGNPANGAQTISVTFNAPAAPPAPAPKATIKPKPTTPAPAPVEPAPPAAPQTAGLEVDGKPVADITTPVSLDSDKSLILKGTTVPNGVVKLYIFSTPREASVTADAQGGWSYTIEGLEPGSHHVEAEVTDPATKKTSARATLATFNVSKAEPKTVATTSSPTKKSSTNYLWLWVLIGLVLVSAGGAVWWWLWKRKTLAKRNDGTPPPAAGSGPIPPSIH